MRCITGQERLPHLGNADVALLFGVDFNLQNIRKNHPDTLIGHLEPRAAQGNETDTYDFMVLNSIEASDYFAVAGQPIFIYPTFPIMHHLAEPEKKDTERRPLRIGYHGNRIHLEAMYPRITEALSRLGKDMEIEFWAMYNIRELGQWSTTGLNNINIKHIQYDPENYSRYIAQVDIGIVPQLIPVRNSRWMRWLIGSISSKFNERHDNFILRFKETTNNGRAFVFAQYRIPIIADMTPSSCALLGENEYGHVAYSSNQWFNALKNLAHDANLRNKMGVALKDRYDHLANPEGVNRRFVDFLVYLYEYRNIKSRAYYELTEI